MKQDFLKRYWTELLASFQIEASVIDQYWQEILKYYSEKHRAYHNLQHLYDLFTKLEVQKKAIKNLPAIQFAIWYHDIIYEPFSKRNEEKSAILCKKRLSELGFDNAFIDTIFKLITSTQTHQTEGWKNPGDQKDNEILLDLDLSILGSTSIKYQEYTQQIRQEYKLVPAILYRSGRKKVLQHFLKKNRIYQTDIFFDMYEAEARENIRTELENL